MRTEILNRPCRPGWSQCRYIDDAGEQCPNEARRSMYTCHRHRRAKGTSGLGARISAKEKTP